MWPYDYFNEYSALRNEFNVDEEDILNRSTKIFLAKWYGETKREMIMREILEDINKDIMVFTGTSAESCSDHVKYRLLLNMPKDTEQGDINIDILGKILESKLIICDITPIAFYNSQKGKQPVFSPNVMGEIGLALAWKMPEQVLVLCDNIEGIASIDKILPFDIQGYFVKYLNFKKEKDEIHKIIVKRLERVDDHKSVIIKNIKSKLDLYTIILCDLRKYKLRGLAFDGNDIDILTARFLLSLGLIRTVIFPRSTDPTRTLTFCYVLTGLGRSLLMDLGIEPFDRLFCDFLFVGSWEGHTSGGHFQEKTEGFQALYRMPWREGEKELRDIFRNNNIEDKDIVGMFNEYCKNNIDNTRPDGQFELIKKTIVEPWLEKVRKRSGREL